ncbi:MAG: hypothetical protein RIA69_06120 [Cyclobacteriaceae bacterium]
MKKSINQFVKILTVLFITSFIISCGTQQNNENQEHSDMMNDNQNEIMEGDEHMHEVEGDVHIHEMEDDGHMHEDEESGGHMMDDTTSTEMNQRMEQ